jgi:Rod binding domain-containing protein
VSKLPTETFGLQASGARAQAETERVKSLSKQVKSSEKEIDKATEGFEALLLHQMLKSMWETVETTGFLGEDSNQAQIMRDMYNQAIADEVAKGRGLESKNR